MPLATRACFLICMTTLAVGPARPVLAAPDEGTADCTNPYRDLVYLRGTLYGSQRDPHTGAYVDEVTGELGTEYARVEATVGLCAASLAEGDASLLAAGTSLYEIEGYRPSFRLAARLPDGDLALYEAMWSDVAKVGEDLLDIRGRVTRMVYRPAAPPDELCCWHYSGPEITNPLVIGVVVELLVNAPVDPSRIRFEYDDLAWPIGTITIDLDDGTSTYVTLLEGLDQTSNGILLPSLFSASLLSNERVNVPIDVREGECFPARLLLPANLDVALMVANTGAQPCRLYVDGLGVALNVAPGETQTVVVNAVPGVHEMRCGGPNDDTTGTLTFK